jgi:hypothetical protein
MMEKARREQSQDKPQQVTPAEEKSRTEQDAQGKRINKPPPGEPRIVEESDRDTSDG